MKDSEGLKTALCLLLFCSLSTHHCITDLLPLQTKPTTSSKGTPGVAQSDSPLRRASSQISLHLTQSEQRAEQSTACRQMLHLLFHSEYTQGAESRHAASTSHASPATDWLVAAVTTGRQAQ